MTKLQKSIAVVGLLAMVLAPAISLAQTPGGVPPEPAPYVPGAGGVYAILDNIITIAFYILMLLAILFILWAAFNYLTAGGDAEKVEKAQRMLLYAVIAIVIGILARSIPWIIATFVTQNVTK